MNQKIYIVTLEGEPQYATTDIKRIKKDFNDWYNNHYDDITIQRDYRYWLEDRTWYPNTDDGEEQAWRDYIEEQFADGTWGDYAWYDTWLD